MSSSQHDYYLQNKRQKENYIAELIKALPDNKANSFYEWLNENYKPWVNFSIYQKDDRLFFGITSSHSQSSTLDILKDIERKLKKIHPK